MIRKPSSTRWCFGVPGTHSNETARSRQCVRWMRDVMKKNPYALPLIDGIIAAAPDAMAAIEILDAFESGFEPHAAKEFELYRRTVRNLGHARILALPSPSTKAANERLLEELDRQECENARLLARCWKDLGGEIFFEECRAASAEYLGSPERTKIKRMSQRFAGTIRAWGRSVKSGRQRKAVGRIAVADVRGPRVAGGRSKDVGRPGIRGAVRIRKTTGSNRRRTRSGGGIRPGVGERRGRRPASTRRSDQ